MMRRIWRGNFVVEQSRQDEADARATRAPNICEHFLERGNGHSDDVAEDDDGGGYGGKPGLTHTVAPVLRARLGDQGCQS